MACALPVLAQTESDDIPDFLYCKICAELPEKVFQCRDGHTLCGACYKNVVDCPICRSRFDKDNPIRNRYFEELLDKVVKVDCAYKMNGCIEQPTRELVHVHQTKCLFNYERFGRLVNLCQLIDYNGCDFRFNTGNIEDAVQHFVLAHSCVLTESDHFQMKLTGFQESIEANLESACFWTPVISDLKERKCFLLTCAMLNGSSSARSLTCFSLLVPKSHEVSETLAMEYSVASDKDCHLEFFQNSLLLSNVESMLPNNLPCSIQIQSLKSHLAEDGSLLVNCNVQESGTNNSSNTDVKVKELEMIVCPKTRISKSSPPACNQGPDSSACNINSKKMKKLKKKANSVADNNKNAESLDDGAFKKPFEAQFNPTSMEMPEDRILVRNLHCSTTEENIKSVFSKFGAMRKIYLLKRKSEASDLRETFIACDSPTAEKIHACIVEFICPGSVTKAIEQKRRIFMRKNGDRRRLDVRVMPSFTSPNKHKGWAFLCQAEDDSVCPPTNSDRDKIAVLVQEEFSKMWQYDREYQSINKYCLLFVSAQNGTYESVRYCIEKGVDVNTTGFMADQESKTNVNVLAIALLDKDKTIGLKKIKLLVEAGADINFKDELGRTLLHMSVIWGSNDDAVKFFLEKGLNVNAVDQAGETPLHSALLSGSRVKLLIEKVKVLLSHGADLTIKNKKGQIPFNLVKLVPSKYQDQIREMLEKHQEHA